MFIKKGRKKRNFISSVPTSVCLLIPRNNAQLERTTNLVGVVGDKPSINDVVGRCIERVYADERRRYEREVSRYYNDLFSAMNDMVDYGYYNDEDFEDLLPHELSRRDIKRMNKKSKRGKRGSNKRVHRYDYDYEDVNGRDKMIYFYDDVDNELSVQEFHSLNEFEIFCNQEGITVGTVDYENLLNWDQVHCCLDPIDKDYGENVLITDSSYGGLYWSVSESLEKCEIHD